MKHVGRSNLACFPFALHLLLTSTVSSPLITANVVVSLSTAVVSPAANTNQTELPLADVFDCAEPRNWSSAKSLGFCSCLSHDHLPHEPLTAPLRWLHVPKCGTTFGITVYHYGCDRLLPEWASPRVLPGKAHKGYPLLYFERCFESRIEQCKMNWKHTKNKQSNHNIESHFSLTTWERKNLTHKVVGLFREPSTRLISAYHHACHGCPKEICGNCNMSAAEYASLHLSHTANNPNKIGPAGCMTRMLIGKPCWGPYPTRMQVLEAIAVLRETFAFVGIQERWEDSICLFHAMLGSRVNFGEFEDTRPGGDKKKHQTWKLKELGDFVDWADEDVYEEATKIFEKNWNKHYLSLDKPDSRVAGCSQRRRFAAE